MQQITSPNWSSFPIYPFLDRKFIDPGKDGIFELSYEKWHNSGLIERQWLAYKTVESLANWSLVIMCDYTDPEFYEVDDLYTQAMEKVFDEENKVEFESNPDAAFQVGKVAKETEYARKRPSWEQRTQPGHEPLVMTAKRDPKTRAMFRLTDRHPDDLREYPDLTAENIWPEGYHKLRPILETWHHHRFKMMLWFFNVLEVGYGLPEGTFEKVLELKFGATIEAPTFFGIDPKTMQVGYVLADKHTDIGLGTPHGWSLDAVLAWNKFGYGFPVRLRSKKHWLFQVGDFLEYLLGGEEEGGAGVIAGLHQVVLFEQTRNWAIERIKQGLKAVRCAKVMFFEPKMTNIAQPLPKFRTKATMAKYPAVPFGRLLQWVLYNTYMRKEKPYWDPKDPMPLDLTPEREAA